MNASRPIATRTYVADERGRAAIIELVETLDAACAASPPPSVTMTVDGVEHRLGPVLVEAFAQVGRVIAHGRPVTVSEQEHLLTPHEAADLLGVTRHELDRMLEASELPFQAVGRHHRIALADLHPLRRDHRGSAADGSDG